MSEPTEQEMEAIQETIEAIKAMGITQDEDQIREALRRCNNNPQEAVQLLLPESPISETNINLLEGYRDVGPPHFGHEISQDSSRDSYDVDMRDTEVHPSPGADSDHDSTTVSYSLEENTIQDLDEEIREGGGGRGERGVVQGEEGDPDEDFRQLERQEHYQVYGTHITTTTSRHDGLLPSYEEVVDDNQSDPSVTPPPPSLGEPDEKITTTPTPVEMGVTSSVSGSGLSSSTSIEFPLTHYYELEGRVHTEQWSIPYKRDESLAICMIAATRMVLEGEWAGLSLVI